MIDTTAAEAHLDPWCLVSLVDGTRILNTRLTELETQKTDLAAQLVSLADPPAVQPPPNAASLYAANLEAALDVPDVRTEAAEALRRLIERVMLTPDPAAPHRLAAELDGDLAMILALAVASEPRRPGQMPRRTAVGTLVPGNQLSVVAGTRNHLDLLLTG